MTKFKSITEVRNSLGRLYKVELPPVAKDKFTPYQVMYRKGWVLMSSSNVVAAYIYEDGHYYALKDAWMKPEILESLEKLTNRKGAEILTHDDVTILER